MFHLVMSVCMEGGDVSSRSAGLGSRGATGYWSWSLWAYGSETRTCGIGLDWHSTGPLTEKAGRRVKLVASSGG